MWGGRSGQTGKHRVPGEGRAKDREDPRVSELKEELTNVRRKFYSYQEKKDEEIKKLKSEQEQMVRHLNRQLEKTVEELRKVKEHSKAQSKRVVELQSSAQGRVATSALEDENLRLQKSIERLGNQLSILEREKEELASDVVLAKATADLYKEDFERERKDRERAAGKIDSLTKREAEQSQGWGLTLQREHEQAETEIKKLEKVVKEAREEAQAKVSQVKHYKKQVDALQWEVKEAQERARQYKKQVESLHQKAYVELPSTESEKRDATFSREPSKKEPFKFFRKRKEDTARKTLERDKMKAAKKEYERVMKEEREQRKQKMASMDEKKQRDYLVKEISRLEDENLTLRNNIECLGVTCRFLVDKLNQTESEVAPPASAVQGPSYRGGVQRQDHYSDGQCFSTEEKFVTAQQTSHNHQRDHRQKPHGQFQLRQRQKSVSGPQPEVTLTGGTPREVRIGLQTHEKLHQASHKPLLLKQSSSDSELRNYLHSNDPVLPKNKAYVNVELQASLAKTVPKKSQDPAASSYSKPPAPSPRSVSMDTERGGPLVVAQQTTKSMPETSSQESDVERKQDISDMINVDICNEAAGVIATGRDERRFTLSHIPFDPFLECLYCNKQFRYGEIQKYRKHVNGCSGSAA